MSSSEAAAPSRLSDAQLAFATCMEPFPAFVGGYGSGKTSAAIARAMALKVRHPDCDVAYYLPSYPLVYDIASQRFPELCERKGFAYKLRGGSSPQIAFPGAGRIVFRSMSNPESIVGYEVAHSICDELDTLPVAHARQVWAKVIARNRQKCGVGNTVAVATTPEGFRFVYERWHKDPKPGYVMFKARTQDNAAHLPTAYIENLRNTYSPAQLTAYLDGSFVNMENGGVYPDFDRALHHRKEAIQPGEALHVGMDFNVTKGAAVVHVLRDGKACAVWEFVSVFDTPAMIALIKARYAGHPIIVYPDASGGGRRSQDASASDLSLLRAAGFAVRNNPANPAIKDRVLAVNKQLRERGYLVDTDACPHLVESLEKQAYDNNGTPDKTQGLDHVIDAAGYFVAYRYPIATRRVGIYV